MVAIEEVQNLIWGVSLEANKKYTQTPEKPFHISMAALHCDTGDGPVQVMVERDSIDYLLCTLVPNSIYQQQLDLNVNEGEHVTFYLKGKGKVDLTGYLLLEPEEEDEDYDGEGSEASSEGDHAGKYLSSGEEESDDEEEDLSDFIDDTPIDDKIYNQLEQMYNSDEDDDSDEDDSDEDDDDSDEDDDDDSEEEGDSEEEEEDDSEMEDSSDEEDDDSDEIDELVPITDKKRKRLSKDQPKKKIKLSDTPQSANKVKKSEITNSNSKSPKLTNGDAQTPSPKKSIKSPKNQTEEDDSDVIEVSDEEKKRHRKRPKTKPERQINGIGIKELKSGDGPMAHKKDTVAMYYTGTLSNGIPFDRRTDGKPFIFKLGKDQVIKGWEIGIQGMKVGSKRRLTIPPKFGYGRLPCGDIPANSTLIFEVELLAAGRDADKLKFGDKYIPSKEEKEQAKKDKKNAKKGKKKALK